MTVETLKSTLERIASLGNVIAPFIPGEWDDLIIEGFTALAASDPILAFIVKVVGEELFMGEPTEEVRMLAEREGFDIATLMLVLQVVGPWLLKLLERRRQPQ